MDPMQRHLDLGCGKFPRNPYGRAELCGVDIRPLAPAGFDYRTANLAVEAIPYPDDHFGSVSAYDFIEHVPRLLPTPDGRGTFFPFVRLMDEIWRVLAPGGRLYALTPAWPHPQAFLDPTHVNIITEQTHTYFCGENPLGRMYGFAGQFEVVRVDWVRIEEAYSANPDAPENHWQRAKRPALKEASRQLRRFTRWLRGKRDPSTAKPPKVYLRWELQAVKPAPH